jgi:hypothetical protein
LFTYLSLTYIQRSKWQAWANQNGTASNILRHLKHKHAHLFPESEVSTSATGKQAGFDLEHFVDKMVTWIIADDQVWKSHYP